MASPGPLHRWQLCLLVLVSVLLVGARCDASISTEGSQQLVASESGGSTKAFVIPLVSGSTPVPSGTTTPSEEQHQTPHYHRRGHRHHRHPHSGSTPAAGEPALPPFPAVPFYDPKHPNYWFPRPDTARGRHHHHHHRRRPHHRSSGSSPGAAAPAEPALPPFPAVPFHDPKHPNYHFPRPGTHPPGSAHSHRRRRRRRKHRHRHGSGAPGPSGHGDHIVIPIVN